MLGNWWGLPGEEHCHGSNATADRKDLIGCSLLNFHGHHSPNGNFINRPSGFYRCEFNCCVPISKNLFILNLYYLARPVKLKIRNTF